MKRRLKDWIARLTGNRFLVLSGDKLTYGKDLLYTYNNADFLRDPRFQQAYSHVSRLDTTGITGEGIEWRIHVLCWAAFHASHLDGDFVDCGVNTGLFARAVMAYVNFGRLGKRYYLLDTFSGLDPKYSSEYEMQRQHSFGYGGGDLLDRVKETFADFDVKIIKGSVPDTLPQVDTDKVAYLSIDMNSVLPEVAALDYFWDRMTPGGLIVLDDYAYPGALEQKRAHDRFAQSKGVQVLTLPTCQGIIIKP